MTEHYQFYRRGSTSRGDSNTLPSSPATHPTTTTQDSATRPAVSDDACRNDSDFYSSSGGTLDVPVASGSYPPEYAFVKFEDAQYAEVPHQQDLYTEHSSYADQQQWQPTDRFPDMFAHTAESLPRFDLAVMMAQAEQSSNADSRQEQQLQVPFLNITNDEEFNPTLDALLSSPECQDDLIHIARTLGVDVPSSPAFSTAGQFRHQSSFTAHSNNEAEGFAGGSWQASYPSLPFQMFGGIENGEEIRLSDQQFRAVPASPIGHIGHDSRHADSQLSPASPFLSPGLSEDDDQLTVNDWVRDEAAPQSPWKSLQVLYDTQRGAESGMPSSIVKMEDILSGEESPIYSRECDSSSASSTSPAPFLSREPTRQSRTPGIIVSPYLESPTPKLESPTPKLEYFGDTGLQPTRKRDDPPRLLLLWRAPVRLPLQQRCRRHLLLENEGGLARLNRLTTRLPSL
ncbi:hypothetical protein DFS34DRAFT_598419 [Phlyctochytrium arcticum]|nr:hypothetical protein DFS34DRAFT_598419 [Phlyctochytrium arcticum]